MIRIRFSCWLFQSELDRQRRLATPNLTSRSCARSVRVATIAEIICKLICVTNVAKIHSSAVQYVPTSFRIDVTFQSTYCEGIRLFTKNISSRLHRRPSKRADNQRWRTSLALATSHNALNRVLEESQRFLKNFVFAILRFFGSTLLYSISLFLFFQSGYFFSLSHWFSSVESKSYHTSCLNFTSCIFDESFYWKDSFPFCFQKHLICKLKSVNQENDEKWGQQYLMIIKHHNPFFLFEFSFLEKTSSLVHTFFKKIWTLNDQGLKRNLRWDISVESFLVVYRACRWLFGGRIVSWWRQTCSFFSGQSTSMRAATHKRSPSSFGCPICLYRAETYTILKLHMMNIHRKRWT